MHRKGIDYLFALIPTMQKQQPVSLLHVQAYLHRCKDCQGEPDVCAVRFFRSPCAEILVVVVRVVSGGLLVEEVVGRVRDERLFADVCRHGAAGRGCNPARGVQPLDEFGCRQRVATGGFVLGSDYLKQDPGNGIRIDGGGVEPLGPDGARVPGVLPRGANRVSLLRRDRVEIGAEIVGRELVIIVIEQGGLRGEECPGEASV